MPAYSGTPGAPSKSVKGPKKARPRKATHAGPPQQELPSGAAKGIARAAGKARKPLPQRSPVVAYAGYKVAKGAHKAAKALPQPKPTGKLFQQRKQAKQALARNLRHQTAVQAKAPHQVFKTPGLLQTPQIAQPHVTGLAGLKQQEVGLRSHIAGLNRQINLRQSRHPENIPFIGSPNTSTFDALALASLGIPGLGTGAAKGVEAVGKLAAGTKAAEAAGRIATRAVESPVGRVAAKAAAPARAAAKKVTSAEANAAKAAAAAGEKRTAAAQASKEAGQGFEARTAKAVGRRVKAAPKAAARAAPRAAARAARIPKTAARVPTSGKTLAQIARPATRSESFAAAALPAKGSYAIPALYNEAQALRKNPGKTLQSTLRVAEQIPTSILAPAQATFESIATGSTKPLAGFAKSTEAYLKEYSALAGPHGQQIAENKLGLLPVVTAGLAAHGISKVARRRIGSGIEIPTEPRAIARARKVLESPKASRADKARAYEAIRKGEAETKRAAHAGRKRTAKREAFKRDSAQAHLTREFKGVDQPGHGFDRKLAEATRHPVTDHVSEGDLVQVLNREGLIPGINGLTKKGALHEIRRRVGRLKPHTKEVAPHEVTSRNVYRAVLQNDHVLEGDSLARLQNLYRHHHQIQQGRSFERMFEHSGVRSGQPLLADEIVRLRPVAVAEGIKLPGEKAGIDEQRLFINRVQRVIERKGLAQPVYAKAEDAAKDRVAAPSLRSTYSRGRQLAKEKRLQGVLHEQGRGREDAGTLLQSLIEQRVGMQQRTTGRHLITEELQGLPDGRRVMTNAEIADNLEAGNLDHAGQKIAIGDLAPLAQHEPDLAREIAAAKHAAKRGPKPRDLYVWGRSAAAVKEISEQTKSAGDFVRAARMAGRLQSGAIIGTSPVWWQLQLAASPIWLAFRHPNPADWIQAAREMHAIHKTVPPEVRTNLQALMGATRGGTGVASLTMRDLKGKDPLAGAWDAFNVARHDTVVGRMVARIGDSLRHGGPGIRSNQWFEAHVRDLAGLMEQDRLSGLDFKGNPRLRSKFRAYVEGVAGFQDTVHTQMSRLKGLSPAERQVYIHDHPEMWRETEQAMENTLGSWAHLSSKERGAQAITIFYPFLRASLRWFGYVAPKDHPWRFALLANLAQQNINQLQRQGALGSGSYFSKYGEIPFYDPQGNTTEGINLYRIAPGGNTLLEAVGSNKLDITTIFAPVQPLISGTAAAIEGKDPFGNPSKVGKGAQVLQNIESLSPVGRALSYKGLPSLVIPQVTYNVKQERLQNRLNALYKTVSYSKGDRDADIYAGRLTQKQAFAKYQRSLDARPELQRLQRATGYETKAQQKQSERQFKKKSTGIYKRSQKVHYPGQPSSSSSGGLFSGGSSSSSGGGLFK